MYSTPQASPSRLPTSPQSSAFNSGTTIANELTQHANQFYSTKDASLLAKIATVIYKHCKESCASVRFNPAAALRVIIQLSSFFAQHHASLPQDSSMRIAAESIGRAASVVISLSGNDPQIATLHQSLRSWSLPKLSPGWAWWQDAQQLAAEKNSSNARSTTQTGFSFRFCSTASINASNVHLHHLGSIRRRNS